MNSSNQRAARRPSLSLSTSPETAKNVLNAVMNGNEAVGELPRARRQAVMRQGSLSNSFTSSRQNAVDNRTLVGPAGSVQPQAKKGGFLNLRRRTMLDEHVRSLSHILCYRLHGTS